MTVQHRRRRCSQDRSSTIGVSHAIYCASAIKGTSSGVVDGQGIPDVIRLRPCTLGDLEESERAEESERRANGQKRRPAERGGGCKAWTGGLELREWVV